MKYLKGLQRDMAGSKHIKNFVSHIHNPKRRNATNPSSLKNEPPLPTEPKASTSPTTSSTYTIPHYEQKKTVISLLILSYSLVSAIS